MFTMFLDRWSLVKVLPCISKCVMYDIVKTLRFAFFALRMTLWESHVRNHKPHVTCLSHTFYNCRPAYMSR